jgi:NAD(P)-dependent dehydrogenase (short-subunit alcohol dehydrogenase family)
MSHHRRLESVLRQLSPAAAASSSSPSLHSHTCSTHTPSPSLTSRGTRLQDRVCIITGAGSGIGRASSLLFARQGAKLVLSDVSEKGLEETVTQIKGEIPDAGVASIVGDVSSEALNESLVQEAVKRFGTLHVFFANAGVVGSNHGMSSFDTIDTETFQRTLQVNVVGAFLGAQAAARYMVSQPPSLCGSIIFTSSVAGLRSGAGGIDYSASKAAVVSITLTLANELAGRNIRVNSVNPGLIETGMTGLLFDHARARKTEGKIGQLNPLRRSGEAHEIAAVALFLASEEASYVNGQAIAVCGGLSSSHPVVPPKVSGK